MTRDMYVEQYIVFDYAGSGLGGWALSKGRSISFRNIHSYIVDFLLLFSIDIYYFLGSSYVCMENEKNEKALIV